MYSRKKNHLVYLQTGKSGSFFWKRGFKKKNEKTKTSLNELPIFFFFSVLLNHAAFLNVLWPLGSHHQNIQLWGDPLYLFLEVSLRLL